MLQPEFLYDQLQNHGTDFFTGVPDSLLKSFCAYITDVVGDQAHIIAANEGSAMGLAAGYHLATGKIPLVYMQNSGMGNTVNPLLSLADADVYQIPLLMVIGWRGEPGVKDEPQHVKQGKVTLELLKTMGVEYCVLSADENEALTQIKNAYQHIAEHQTPYALVIRKGVFADYKLKNNIPVVAEMTREQAIGAIARQAGIQDIFVATTGMASRELYEIRNAMGQGHEKDFLTVGSMGHSSQIALAIALQKSERRIFCLDGDGACIMHLGGMTTIGSQKPHNLVHIVINNGAHDSVGGQPTVGLQLDLVAIARACGYAHAQSVATKANLEQALQNLNTTAANGPIFIEVKTTKGARADLGRPQESPQQNKALFMEFLND